MALFRGSGGAVFDIEIPAEGTRERERHDHQVASGDLVPAGTETKPATVKPAVRKPGKADGAEGP